MQRHDLSAESASHFAVTRPPLVACARANRVPTGCSGVSLPARPRPVVPLDRTTACGRCGFQTATAVCVHDGTGSAQDATLNNRRPCVSGRGRTRLEQSTTSCHAVPITADFQAETENRTLCAVLFCMTPNRHQLIAAAAVAFCVFTLLCFVTLKFLGTIRLVNAIRFYITLHYWFQLQFQCSICRRGVREGSTPFAKHSTPLCKTKTQLKGVALDPL